VDERRALAGARVADRCLHRAVTGQEIGAVDALHEEPRKRRDELRDVAPGGLDLHRHGDRVAVVLDEVDDGEAPETGRVQRLPELTLARRALSDREIHDLVLAEVLVAVGNRLDRLVEVAGLRRADRVQALGARRAGTRDDVQRLVTPV
jgi:hypothetical protein